MKCYGNLLTVHLKISEKHAPNRPGQMTPHTPHQPKERKYCTFIHTNDTNQKALRSQGTSISPDKTESVAVEGSFAMTEIHYVAATGMPLTRVHKEEGKGKMSPSSQLSWLYVGKESLHSFTGRLARIQTLTGKIGSWRSYF